MTEKIKTFKVTILVLFFINMMAQGQNNINVVPMPVKVKMGKGMSVIKQPIGFIVYDFENTAENDGVESFKTYLEKTYRLTKFIDGDSHSYGLPFEIHYSILNKKTRIGYYELEVTGNRIYIKGTALGKFFAFETLKQLITVNTKKQIVIPNCKINDYPRFQYRGMHLDVSRHFFSVDQVKRYIDHLADYKFNTFHWHLTDDQGWRIEIKKYPKLTSTGAYRNGTIIGSYPGTGNDSIRYGGFYTHEQVKEIVKYAAARYINIIPEIEMPGHSSAAIAAYPELSCFPGESSAVPANTAWAGSRKGKQVQQSWGVFEDVLCPTEYTFKFLEDVLDEVMRLFPSEYIHIGGDESPKESWKRSAFCQQLIKEKKLTDEQGLQSYFIQRVEKYVNSKGKKIIGWDEIMEGGPAPNATIMSWRGETGGIVAAKQDHDVIMTPESPLYLNLSQTKNEDSVTQGGYNPIENVYNYEPVPASLNETEAKHILGAQGNMWSEHLKDQRKLEYMLFPRIAALSEVLWTPKEKKNWKDFERRLPAIMKKLDEQKINYSKAYYDLEGTVLPTENNEGILWKLESKDPGNDIVYVNSQPGNAWLNYIGPLLIKYTDTLSAALTDKNKKIAGNWFTQKFSVNKATGKKVSLANQPSKNYPGDGAFTLVNGIQNEKGMSRSSEFLGFSGTDLDATIDLGEETGISKIILHLFDQAGSWIYLPVSIEVTCSAAADSGNTGIILKKIIDPVKDMGTKTISIETVQKCRYLHIVAKNMGVIPDGNPGSGHPAWLFVDEIEVK
ncbi:MAG: beta-N-acetylhexosaminidase [Ferruginibacter sp.]